LESAYPRTIKKIKAKDKERVLVNPALENLEADEDARRMDEERERLRVREGACTVAVGRARRAFPSHPLRPLRVGAQTGFAIRRGIVDAAKEHDSLQPIPSA